MTVKCRWQLIRRGNVSLTTMPWSQVSNIKIIHVSAEINLSVVLVPRLHITDEQNIKIVYLVNQLETVVVILIV